MTVEAQAQSQMPLILKKFRAHSVYLLAELQYRQLLRGTEQAVQAPALRKYPLLQSEQMILPPPFCAQVVQKEQQWSNSADNADHSKWSNLVPMRIRWLMRRIECPKDRPGSWLRPWRRRTRC